MSKIHTIKLSEEVRMELLGASLAGHLSGLRDLFENLPTTKEEEEEWMFDVIKHCAAITQITTLPEPGENNE
jgi:hypothetical protein